MSDLVAFAVINGVGVITIQNPPVNALSPGVPEGIAEAIARVEKDDAIQGAVILGGGRTFVAGGGVKEGKARTSRARTRRGRRQTSPIKARRVCRPRGARLRWTGPRCGVVPAACVTPR